MEWILVFIFSMWFGIDDTIQEEYMTSMTRYIEKENSKIVFYDSIIDSEMAWLETTPLDTGVIPMYKKKNGDIDVIPYFSNTVAEAMIEVNPQDQYGYVKYYITWYLDHLNDSGEDPYGIEGTIFDYKVTIDGQNQVDIKSKDKYDSIDSYAATFITLFNTYVLESGDKEIVDHRWQDVKKVHNALLETSYRGMVVNNLKDYNRYLMDNTEAYDAVTSTLEYFKCFKGTDHYYDNLYLIFRYTFLKHTLERTIEYMWTNNNHYHMVILKDGKVPESFSWDVFYPDATSQIFPIIYDIIAYDSERAEIIYNKFNEHFKWEQLEHLNVEVDGFYWGRLAYLAAIMNDEYRLNTYVRNYRKSVAKSRTYPLMTTETAWIIKGLNNQIIKSRSKISYTEGVMSMLESIKKMRD